ncbi:ABC-type dipeptide/oligopeptide/nickel transport system, ATPase component [Fulvimarina pelagi HTCC2506]|uniref:ABC-type dipeptide/oligopeptide/nickel transport system, ATPase component n=1 Tax=Fulvimarina pelagi HTCC2506 TaxID=314231 RepID=Q0G810_9HYPH|nr:dipeptide/oligopeptide/nickel ABC transporter permease/ATP-binding protein [Fulvimarina pelagi]EAU42204.1 ABC-type dipeptide/oligopeptide/nickel transport system, ATPase component [Fulvimarina pelagi HTCC2506]
MSAVAAEGREAKAGSGRPSSITLLFNNRLATFGLSVLVLVVLTALLAPILPLADPNATDPASRLTPPFADGHILGTDALGRDMLSRLIWGTRVSLAVGFSASLIAAFAGSTIGLVAGYAGGRTDQALMRFIDLMMAFPYILLALAIVAILGPGLINALYAIAIVNVPFFARNIRGLTVGLARREFIDAARLSGKSSLAIIGTEVLPNVLPTIVITLSTTIGWMILETAGLSFLGLGAQPPQADLGSMLGEGRKVLFTTPFVSLVPGLMIFFIVLSINLLGDGIRDVLDPRLRSGALARPSARTDIAEDRVAGQSSARDDQVLDVKDLRTEFRIGRSIHKAVGGVDLAIAPGECLGLLGESGSGKSVTAMSLTGLVPSPPGLIAGGRIGFLGEDLLDVSDKRLRNLRGGDIAYVFQDPLATLHPLFTAGEQLIEAIRAHQDVDRAEARERALTLMRQVRIPNAEARMDAYPHKLSGGLRQRVSIAMALANDPKLIIADEPTTALDVTVQAQVLKLLDDLRKERGTAVLFITHDFGVVSEIADRVAVMYAGRIVETGPTGEVMANPAHPYTRMLVDCVPVMGEPDRRLSAIRGRPPAVDKLPKGCAFAPRCPRAEADCRRGTIPMEVKRGRIEARCIHPLAPGEALETGA